MTRLPSELDAPQVLGVLQLGLKGGRPVKAVLADAVSGKPRSAGDWKLLACCAWDTDEQQLVPKSEQAALLARLAAATPPAEADTATRLWLIALAASAISPCAGCARSSMASARRSKAKPANAPPASRC